LLRPIRDEDREFLRLSFVRVEDRGVYMLMRRPVGVG